MASAGATFPIDIASGGDHHFLVVESRHHQERADDLLRGAIDVLAHAGASFDVVSLQGVLELPGSVAMAIEAGDYDGVVALGVVIQDTPAHLGHIVPEVTRALLELSVVDSLPLGIGLVSANNDSEARGQTETIGRNMGAVAAKAALAMAALKHKLNA